jgi:hypothetical protein
MSLPPRPTLPPPLLNATPDDARIYFDRASASWRCEVDDAAREQLGVAAVGVAEMEWQAQGERWKPVLDEEEVRRQQQAYGVSGVDEEVSVPPRETRPRAGQSQGRRSHETCAALAREKARNGEERRAQVHACNTRCSLSLRQSCVDVYKKGQHERWRAQSRLLIAVPCALQVEQDGSGPP